MTLCDFAGMLVMNSPKAKAKMQGSGVSGEVSFLRSAEMLLWWQISQVCQSKKKIANAEFLDFTYIRAATAAGAPILRLRTQKGTIIRATVRIPATPAICRRSLEITVGRGWRS